MQAGSGLSKVFSGLVGTHPGAGMSLIFVFSGLMAMLVGLAGYLVPAIRDAETILPDQDTLPEVHGRIGFGDRTCIKLCVERELLFYQGGYVFLQHFSINSAEPDQAHISLPVHHIRAGQPVIAENLQ